VPPYLAGGEIRTYASIGIENVDDAQFHSIPDALTVTFAAPEPGSFWIFGVALGLIGLLRFRTKRSVA
jgi:hypothetical protein